MAKETIDPIDHFCREAYTHFQKNRCQERKADKNKQGSEDQMKVMAFKPTFKNPVPILGFIAKVHSN